MAAMEATDMRSLSGDARHERRVQGIRLRKAGCTYAGIAAQTGLSRTGVFDICKRHTESGAMALHDAPSGRKTGDGRLLTAAQEAVVRKLIADKTPDQLKMPYALWRLTMRPEPTSCPKFSASSSSVEATRPLSGRKLPAAITTSVSRKRVARRRTSAS